MGGGGGGGEAKKADTGKMQINKYTGRPFSQKFWTILEKRKSLPVWDYYTKFMELVKIHQCVVLVGETGSGKTTQVGDDPLVIYFPTCFMFANNCHYVCMWWC